MKAASRVLRNRNSWTGMRKWASLAGLALGGLLLTTPSVAEARCKTKPAVCARLAAQKAQKAQHAQETQMARQAPQVQAQQFVVRQDTTPCKSKPAVCARLRNSAEPVQRIFVPVDPPETRMAEGVRCKTKPAVCARLRDRYDVWM